MTDVGTPFTCSAGAPNPSSAITRIVGTPRKKSAYAIASAQREEHRARQGAQHGNEEREGEDEDLGDAEDLHVQPERARDLREGVLEVAPVEERRPDLLPAGRMRDRDGEED